VRALVGADQTGPVFAQPHFAEKATAKPHRAVLHSVPLSEGPKRGLGVQHEDAGSLPLVEQPAGILVWRLADRKVHVHDVVGATRRQIPARGPVDHVIGRGGEAIQRSRLADVVVQGMQRLDVGHWR
jgi:hypothetical protein